MPDENNQGQEEPKTNIQPVINEPETQFSAYSTPPSTFKPPKKSKKVLFTVLGAALIVILIATGTVAYLLLNKSTPESSSDQEPGDDALTLQLTEIYKNSSSDAGQDAKLHALVVQESGTVGYKNAHARTSGIDSSDSRFAHFYQTPDETWRFFILASDQDQVSCDRYNTEDLVKAFVGFTCQDAGGSSFVQTEQPEFEIVPDSIGE